VIPKLVEQVQLSLQRTYLHLKISLTHDLIHNVAGREH